MYGLVCGFGIARFFSRQELLEKFTENGTYFTSHVNHHLPGVEFSTGSLGML